MDSNRYWSNLLKVTSNRQEAFMGKFKRSIERVAHKIIIYHISNKLQSFHNSKITQEDQVGRKPRFREFHQPWVVTSKPTFLEGIHQIRAVRTQCHQRSCLVLCTPPPNSMSHLDKVLEDKLDIFNKIGWLPKTCQGLVIKKLEKLCQFRVLVPRFHLRISKNCNY